VNALAGEMTLLSMAATLPRSRDFGCIGLLCLASIILGITLSLSWWGSYIHSLHQLVHVLHLHHDLLFGLKKFSLDYQELLKRWGSALNVIVVTVVGIATSFAIWIIEVDGKIRWGKDEL
jgi:hypothetical protein